MHPDLLKRQERRCKLALCGLAALTGVPLVAWCLWVLARALSNPASHQLWEVR
jgi:hypothetical protein